MYSIAVIGAGYVGLTTSAYLAHLGHRVVCADIDAIKVRALSHGHLHIVEEGLEEMVRNGVADGRLSFVVGAAAAVTESEFVFLCLPTPPREDGSADLAYVLAAAAELGPHLKPHSILINKSTVPVGTAQLVAETIDRSDVSVISNPEFLREGSALRDCLNPDRIIIAGSDPDARARVAKLYGSLGVPVVLTDSASAEMIKYAANAMLATRLSFLNAIATLCERVGADIRDVLLGLGYDRRIGFDFLSVGPGWGGSCFPKDTKALLHLANQFEFDFRLLRGAIEDNEDQFDLVVDKVRWMVAGSLEGVNVAVWGLAFKAGTNDVRESPAVEVVTRLLSAGARVQAYDPAAATAPLGVALVADMYEAARNADVLVILTEWPEFGKADLGEVHRVMAAPRIVDARNVLRPEAATSWGFAYAGRGVNVPADRPSARVIVLDEEDDFCSAAS